MSSSVGEQLVTCVLGVHLPLPKNDRRELRDAHAVRVVLRLQCKRPAPLVELRLHAERLASLARDARSRVRAVQEIARIDLHAGLGRPHAQPNASEWRVHLHEDWRLPERRVRRPAAEEPRVVVSTHRRHGALVDVPTKGLPRAEIQRGRVGHRGDDPGGQEFRVDLDVLVARGHLHDMLHHRRRVLDIAIQVEVGMVCQCQDSVLVRRGIVRDQPLVVFSHRMGDLQSDRSWKALLPIGGYVLERDAVPSLCHDVENSSVETFPTAMQGVEAIFVQWGAVLFALQLERAMADSVRNAANGCAEICVLWGCAVFAGVVPAQNYIDWALSASCEHEMRQRRAIPDQCRPGRPCGIAELDGLKRALRLGVAREVRRRRRRSPQRRWAAEAHRQHHQHTAEQHRTDRRMMNCRHHRDSDALNTCADTPTKRDNT
eukprot:CAMPEP_0198543552 /NCGR_PEP_ID=MMETSP1462-20131121/59721_1 /TAXON_ID=1333877 /ORGANISM="Brandtodinium nutriculum, Strain RCC3387" /LENGTH=430 /DNA_ID=CAMNT_0044273839 /DNA_START=408 /DNA_END=1696 /DNA_ORIENTATION=-